MLVQGPKIQLNFHQNCNSIIITVDARWRNKKSCMFVRWTLQTTDQLSEAADEFHNSFLVFYTFSPADDKRHFKVLLIDWQAQLKLKFIATRVQNVCLL